MLEFFLFFCLYFGVYLSFIDTVKDPGMNYVIMPYNYETQIKVCFYIIGYYTYFMDERENTSV